MKREDERCPRCGSPDPARKWKACCYRVKFHPFHTHPHPQPEDIDPAQSDDGLVGDLQKIGIGCGDTISRDGGRCGVVGSCGACEAEQLTLSNAAARIEELNKALEHYGKACDCFEQRAEQAEAKYIEATKERTAKP
jgi:hypothetical protein